MNFELTEAQEEIVRQVRTLCTNFPDEYWREHDRRAEFPHDFFAAVASAGYLGVAIPERYGGSGLGITEAALVMREVAASGGAMAAAMLAAYPDVFAAGAVVAGLPVGAATSTTEALAHMAEAGPQRSSAGWAEHVFEEGMLYVRVRFTDQTELCWVLQTAHVILEADLGDWKTGDFKQLAVFVQNESDFG